MFGFHSCETQSLFIKALPCGLLSMPDRHSWGIRVAQLVEQDNLGTGERNVGIGFLVNVL